MKELKFAGGLAASREISELMLAAQQPAQLPDCLIPVPLHRRRLIARGYNQAAELARHLGVACHLPVLPDVCVRTRETISQTELGAAKRAGNVRGAFRVRAPIGFRHVGIVDDVVTTGSTVAEIARVLKRAGVERVDVWAAARAPAP